MKFHIWCAGSPGVGIPGKECVLDWPALSEDKTDIATSEYIVFIKENLRRSFMDIFDDGSVHVMTEAEFEEYTRDDDT